MNNELISRDALNETIDKITWYHINSDGELVEGAHDDGDALYKAEDIYKAIDNAPTVEYTFEEAFQKTVCEQRLYCPARPQGEWKDESRDSLLCTCCNKRIYKPFIGGFPTERSQHYYPNFCAFCGVDMRKGDAEK